MYPTSEMVERGTHYHLANWYRHLPSPKDEPQLALMNRICQRFKEMGGFNPQLSKAVGW